MCRLRRLYVFDKSVRKLCLVVVIVCTFVLLARNVNQLLTFPSFNDGGAYLSGIDPTTRDYTIVDELSASKVQIQHEFKARSLKGFLTIGISSAYRSKGEYLINTLNSIINQSTAEERDGVTVILSLSDSDQTRREMTAHHITHLFRPYVQSGFLLVIEALPKIYPKLTNLTSTFGDSAERMSWRAKQAIDFSYLFQISKDVSLYYMILEDDITCLQGYLTEIRNTIQRLENKKWLRINFSSFLIIGMMFESKLLEEISQFILLFYASQPVDFLILSYFDILAPGKAAKEYFIQRIPSLFQHVGYYSSLEGKLQKLEDKTFPGDLPQLYLKNPTAQIFTTIPTYDQYFPHFAYTSNLSFFWGIPRQGDTYDIVFPDPVKLSRVVIVTGLPVTSDLLHNGLLLSSPRFISLLTPNQVHCQGFRAVAKFAQGIVNVTEFQSPYVQCLRVLINETQKSWLIIRRIAIFL